LPEAIVNTPTGGDGGDSAIHGGGGTAVKDLPTRIRSALVGDTNVTSVSAPARQAQPSMSRRARILVADDERRIRLALRSCLEAEGYRVQEAADGVEALDSIIRNAPDLLILDLAMPNLDGMRVMAKLQEVNPQLKPRVIVLTAWGSVPAMLKARDMGAEIFLEKPIDPETLRRAVAQALAGCPTLTEKPEAQTDSTS
jgi:CheY-like chemotaxis protein